MTSMLDPEVKPSPAKKIAHKGKGCLAVLVAAAVLIFGGYFVWDKASTFMERLGEVPDYPGPGKATITLTIPDGASLDEIGGILVDDDVVKSLKAWNQAVDSEERATSVQAGSYVMKTQMKAIDALRPADQSGRLAGPAAVHHPGRSPADRAGRRAGQRHQDQEDQPTRRP